MTIIKKHEIVFAILFFMPIYIGIIKGWMIDHDYLSIFDYPSREIRLLWSLLTVVTFMLVSKYKEVK
jgi:hypothetical protein